MRALYGPPASGGYWEKKCDEHLTSVGFRQVPNWPSCYLHDQLRLFLTVCVDDFQMSGTKANLAKGWELIRNGIKMEDPTPLKRYLGCEHYACHAQFDQSKFPLRDLDLVQDGLVGPEDQAAGSVFATSVTDPQQLDAQGDARQLFAWPFCSCLLDAQPCMSPAVGKPLPTCSGSLSFRNEGQVICSARFTGQGGSSDGV